MGNNPHYVAQAEDHKILDDNTFYIENEFIKFGINTELGGTVTYLAEHGKPNLINSADWGRQVQLSFYSGPTPFHPAGTEMGKNWTHTGWNPIQTGDCFFNRSKLIEYQVEGNTLYVKCVPMQWALNNVPGECTFELWYTLDGKTVNVTARLNNNRADKTQYRACGQELPAVYTNGEFYRIISYVGEHPGTGGALTEIVSKNTGDRNWPSEFMLYPEGWVALVDDYDYGLGVYNPHTCGAVGGFAGGVERMGWGGAKDFHTATVSPTTSVILDHNIVYTFHFSLIVGDLDSIRQTALEMDAKVDHRKFDFSKDRPNFYYIHTTDKGFSCPSHTEEIIEIEGENPQHRGILRNVTNTLLGKEELYAPAEDGLNGVMLANAMHLSAFENRTVDMPFPAKRFKKHLDKMIKKSKSGKK